VRMQLTGAGGNDVSRRWCKFDGDEEHAGQAEVHKCGVRCCSHVSATGIEPPCRAAHSCALWTPHPSKHTVRSTPLTDAVYAPPVPELSGRHPSRFARCAPPPPPPQSFPKRRGAPPFPAPPPPPPASTICAQAAEVLPFQYSSGDSPGPIHGPAFHIVRSRRRVGHRSN